MLCCGGVYLQANLWCKIIECGLKIAALITLSWDCSGTANPQSLEQFQLPPLPTKNDLTVEHEQTGMSQSNSVVWTWISHLVFITWGLRHVIKTIEEHYLKDFFQTCYIFKINIKWPEGKRGDATLKEKSNRTRYSRLSHILCILMGPFNHSPYCVTLFNNFPLGNLALACHSLCMVPIKSVDCNMESWHGSECY